MSNIRKLQIRANDTLTETFSIASVWDQQHSRGTSRKVCGLALGPKTVNADPITLNADTVEERYPIIVFEANK